MMSVTTYCVLSGLFPHFKVLSLIFLYKPFYNRNESAFVLRLQTWRWVLKEWFEIRFGAKIGEMGKFCKIKQI